MQAPFQAKNDCDAAQTDIAKTITHKRVLADNRPEAVAQDKLAEMMNISPRVLQQRALSDAIHNSPRMVAQRREVNALFVATGLPLVQPSETPAPCATAGTVVQAVSDGTKVDRPLLGHVVEDQFMLNQWKNGEFFAYNLGPLAVDQQHVHNFEPALYAASVTFEGHVVSAKKINERNQTSHKIVGEKNQDDEWAVQAQVVTVRKEIPEGSFIPADRSDGLADAQNPCIPHDEHDAFAATLRETTRGAVEYMMNMSDDEVAPGKESAKKRKDDQDKSRKEQLEFKQLEKANREPDNDESYAAMVGMFD